ncbi:hypothetical protein HKX48_006072 [Thoreauomyces humboldtii]|nr:hypothetical protein HKX48_006072 [Thoreauomyces humboldtii]
MSQANIEHVDSQTISESKPASIEALSTPAPKKRMNSTAVYIFATVILPLILFYVLQTQYALLPTLIISSIPPILHTIYDFLKNRRIDTLGLIIIVSFAATLAIGEATKNVRVLLLSNSIVMLLMGGCWILGLVLGKRPALFEIAAREEPERFEALWTESEGFRRLMRRLTIMWGVGLVVGFVGTVVVVMVVRDVETATNVTNWLAPGVIVALGLATSMVTKRAHRDVGAEVPDVETGVAQPKVVG